MDRFEFMRSAISRSETGVEIGPLHNPICAKRDGWNTLVMDAFTSLQLRDQYCDDPNVDINLIEDVDILYRRSFRDSIDAYSSNLGDFGSESSESISYIISSHNFEHQPNPIQFLSDCEHCLKLGGSLVMAIPIASRCFDCWLPLTTTGMALDAFVSGDEKPSIGAIFDSLQTQARLQNGQPLHDQTYDYNQVRLDTGFDKNWLEMLNSNHKINYIDSHVSRFNPFNFELLFRESIQLGLLKQLSLERCVVSGAEFLTVIKKVKPVESSDCLSSDERTELFKKAVLFHASDVSQDKFLKLQFK